MSEFPRIPRYDLVEEVGSGGMSVVYRARDTTLDREVAVKVLHRHLAGRESERARFRQEAQAVARLSHPHILEIHDYSGEDTADAWIVSEFIRGPTLRGFAETTGFGLPTIGALVAERLARALTHAHGIGIIHRDLKPENVMVQDDGAIKLTDFGIARMVDRDTRMTSTGTLLGSPAHMAPELIEGKGCDARSDVFSLGTVLYWLVCGALPFRGDNPAEVLRKILEGLCDDPRQIDPRVSDPLAAIVQKAMARDPEDRYPTAEAMADALATYLRDLGLDRPDEEIRAFFADPAATKESLRHRLIDAWLERAEAAIGARAIPEAIGACNAALGLDPSNERATLLLLTMRRRRDLRRGLLAVGLVALLAGSAVAIVVAWPKPPTPRLPLAPPEAARGLFTAGEPPASDPTDETLVSDPLTTHFAVEKRSELGPSLPPPRNVRPVVRARPRPVRILVEPYADIYIDDTHLAQDREARTRLLPGAHRLRIVREGFVTLNLRLLIATGKELFERRFRLQPQPATLRIENTQEGILSLGEKLIGPIGDGLREVPVTFPPGPDGRYPLERDLQMKVEKPGYLPRVQQLKLRPGQTLTLNVALEPSA